MQKWNHDYVAVYSDGIGVNTTSFENVTDYAMWVDSGLEFGIKWAMLLEKDTGKVLEYDCERT